MLASQVISCQPLSKTSDYDEAPPASSDGPILLPKYFPAQLPFRKLKNVFVYMSKFSHLLNGGLGMKYS